MRGYNCHEEIEIYLAADRVCFKAGRDRSVGGGSMSQDGHLGADLLQLEKEVFRSGNGRTASFASARRRKCPAQTGGGGFNARQTDAAGRSQKKALRAKERRQLVRKLIDEYRVSLRRACAVCLLARSLAYYKSHGRDDRAVRLRIREIAAASVRYGMTRIHVLLSAKALRIITNECAGFIKKKD